MQPVFVDRQSQQVSQCAICFRGGAARTSSCLQTIGMLIMILLHVGVGLKMHVRPLTKTITITSTTYQQKKLQSSPKCRDVVASRIPFELSLHKEVFITLPSGSSKLLPDSRQIQHVG